MKGVWKTGRPEYSGSQVVNLHVVGRDTQSTPDLKWLITSVQIRYHRRLHNCYEFWRNKKDVPKKAPKIKRKNLETQKKYRGFLENPEKIPMTRKSFNPKIRRGNVLRHVMSNVLRRWVKSPSLDWTRLFSPHPSWPMSAFVPSLNDSDWSVNLQLTRSFWSSKNILKVRISENGVSRDGYFEFTGSENCHVIKDATPD